jgi:long-chain acyl-CoA synthetase
MSLVQQLREKIGFQNIVSEDTLYNKVKKSLTINGKIIFVGNLLERAAKNYPNQTAVICQKKSISYEELFLRSVLLSKKIKNLGIKPGDKALLLFENSIEFYISYFAILQIGAVCVPLNTFLHQKELLSIINDCHPKIVVISKKLSSNLTNIQHKDLKILRGDDIDWNVCIEDLKNEAKDFTLQTLPENEVCLLLYTSGTTGVPKGVMLSSRNIMANTIQSLARLGMHMKLKDSLDKNEIFKERFLAALPLFHSFAQNTCVWFPIAMCGTIIVIPKIDRREILEGLKEKPTFFGGVPALYGLLCLMKTAPLDSIKLFVSGGDAMPDKIRCAFSMVYGRKICAGYGLSEASPVVAVNIENKENSTNVVGKPLVGIECDIRDEGGKPIGKSKIGMLWIRGENIMLGYYNSPEETSKILKDGWLNTGDLARLDANNHLEIMGRSKDLIIHKGFNIYPQEIENVLLTHPAVFKAAVVAHEDATSGQVPIAFVAVKPGDETVEFRLKGFCDEYLASYKIPRKFVCLDDLPMNSTGKVDKKKLQI